MKRIRLLFAAVIFAAAFTACNSDNPITERNKHIEKLYKNGQAKIAIVTSFGKDHSRALLGTDLALKKIKKENLCDIDIQAVYYEDKAKANNGMSIAYEIANDESISAVIGHEYSDISMPCSLIYQYYGILMLNPEATISSLTKNKNNYLFRNIPTDSVIGQKAVELCQKEDFSDVLIFNANTAYGNSLANSFELAASKNNINIINRDVFEKESSPLNFNSKIKLWKNNYIFDAIFLAGSQPEINTIVKCIRDNGIEVPIIGADSFEDPVFYSNLSEAENNRIYSVSNFNINSDYPPFIEFRKEFIEEYGFEPDLYACQGYDIVMVLAKSIKLANSALPEKVSEAMRSAEWQEAAGPYTFNESGDISGKEMYMKIYRDGKFIQE